MTNEKLSPLEALEIIKHTTDLYRPNELNGYKNELDIIETALKRNVELELANIELEHHLKLAEKELNENERKLKALEIIKEKRVDVCLLISCIYDFDLDYYNSCMCNKERCLTQEEYDLLKEVLL